MNIRQCPSCGGICKKSGCERANIDRSKSQAWRDAPDAPGLWANDYSSNILKITQLDVDHWIWSVPNTRWFGPIPPLEDK